MKTPDNLFLKITGYDRTSVAQMLATLDSFEGETQAHYRHARGLGDTLSKGLAEPLDTNEKIHGLTLLRHEQAILYERLPIIERQLRDVRHAMSGELGKLRGAVRAAFDSSRDAAVASLVPGLKAIVGTDIEAAALATQTSAVKSIEHRAEDWDSGADPAHPEFTVRVGLAIAKRLDLGEAL